MPITKLCKQIFGYRHGPDWVVFCSAQPQLCGAGHNEHADKHEWKGIFDKKNQDDFTFYDQTVIHTQAVYVQKAHNYSVTFVIMWNQQPLENN